jgi:hypothetical protein
MNPNSIRRPVFSACLLQAAVLALGVGLAPLAHAQKAFPSPEAAAEALVDGVASHNDAAVKAVLGHDYARVLPPGNSDPEDVTAFLAAWAKKHAITRRDERTAFLEVGDPLASIPIPIVRTTTGWRFDVRGADDEMRTRRIGRNELAAIRAALAYTDAQDEYFSADPDGNGIRSYAAKLISSPGKRDGLYWPALPGEPVSPLGPMIGSQSTREAYHGYFFRVLTAQGPSAPGGAKSYVKDGRMTEGYALVAWPARYGDTGVMTFIVSRDGVVHEKDLGARTDAVARAMKSYDPDSSWGRSRLVED